MIDVKFMGAVLVAMGVSSCATVIRGVHEDLKVVSSPPGANVSLSTGESGITPVSFVKHRRENFQVTVSKPGYISQTVKVESRASASGAAATAADAPLGVVGVAVDAGTGAWNSLYPNPVSVQLSPMPVDSRALRRNARQGQYPRGILSDQPGMVRSPYTQRLYDVKAIPHRSLVHDVDVDKLFINP